MIATKSSFEPHSSDGLPKSTKVYVPGKIHPDLRVPFREIALNPTKSFDGRGAVNDPVRVYDCSGPWGDAAYLGTVEDGLPKTRREWVLSRGDVEETAGRNAEGKFGATKPLRAKRGKVVTQLHYARQGIITLEMEYIALR